MIDAFVRETPHVLDLAPQAEIDKPVSFFKQRGLEFTVDSDDLDEYEFTDVAGSQAAPPFALMQYRTGGHKTILLFSSDVCREYGFDLAVNSIARALDVPIEAFAWDRDAVKPSGS